jgi:hypothetical protein
MGTINIIIITVASLFTLIWLYAIRYNMQRANRASQSSINSTSLHIVCILIVVIFKISALHLLWMFPVSVIIGLLYLTLPFSLISILAIPLEKLLYIGLDRNEIKKQNDDVREVIRLMKMEKMTREDAMKIVKGKRSEQKPIS